MPPKTKAKKQEEDLDAILNQVKELDKKKKVVASGTTTSQPVTESSSSSVAPAASPSVSQKAKKTPTEQTWPEPTVGISKLFANKKYPVGEIMPHAGSFNEYRATSAEKKALETLFEQELENARRAAECHRTVRKWLRSWVKPGMKMYDIVEKTEAKVRELIEGDHWSTSGIGFPMGCSLNNCAAHYTPNTGDNTILGPDDVVKFDIGIHVGGRIVDSAFTMCWNDQYIPLLNATKAATNAGVKAAGIDVRLCDVGAAIQEVMESYEVTIGNKTFPVKAVKNLCGHNIIPHRIHGGKSVPSFDNKDQTKMEENEFFAIETFGSTGRGWVQDEGECSHYMKEMDALSIPIRNPRSKQLLQAITKHFHTLPFCRRYLDRFGEEKYALALKNLVDIGAVQACPPLCDIKGSYVAQFEHTFCLRPTCKEVLSRGEDY